MWLNKVTYYNSIYNRDIILKFWYCISDVLTGSTFNLSLVDITLSILYFEIITFEVNKIQLNFPSKVLNLLKFHETIIPVSTVKYDCLAVLTTLTHDHQHILPAVMK